MGPVESMKKRLKKAALAVVVVGGLAATSVAGEGVFMMSFFVIFFGGIAGAVVALSRSNGSVTDIGGVDFVDHDPFVDQDGVRHSSPQPMQPQQQALPSANS